MFNGNIGMPIGNYTSQYFANIYMNELDNYIKQELRMKYYIRYMDDFILCLRSKEECIEIKLKIEKFLITNLKLELNKKSRYYPSKMGADFCGYRIWETHILIRNSCKKKMKKTIKEMNKKYRCKNLNLRKAIQRLSSFKGHVLHANTYLLCEKIINAAEFIYTENTAVLLEKNLQEYITENS